MAGAADAGTRPPAPSDPAAVIDIGTNSTRLLVARVADGRVDELDRRTRVTRLGRGVDLSGRLATEAIEDVCAVIAEYVAALRDHGASDVDAIATSAVRDADNGEAFIAELRERFDLEARILEGEQEALLTYRGATARRATEGPLLVVDIGGGSTEVIIGSDGGVGFHVSLQAGVVRHSERHLAEDPPGAAELESLASDVWGLFDEAVAAYTGPTVQAGIAVAGTPTSLAAIDQRLDPYDRDKVHGYRLTLDSVQRMLSQLASMAIAERRRVPGLHPDRAPTIVAGVVILVEAMRAFDLNEVMASEHDLLHGAAIEMAQARNPH
jgi:exopolyphosphatase / guanosine-5'-triphosphate,3'-diphosphate pyrophosphatase